MITIELTMQEMMTAAVVGVRRQISAMANKRYDCSNKMREDPFGVHILGAMGELAAAKYFNLFWPDHVGIIEGADVGGLIEVKCRKLRGNGLDLPVSNVSKKAEMPFLLVHGDLPQFRLVGWIFGKEGWEIGRENGLPDVRFVPGVVPPLHPPETLWEIIKH